MLLRGVIHLALWLLLVVTLLLRGAVALLGGIISLATLLASVVVLSSTTALGWWGVRVVAAVIVDRGGIRRGWAGLEKRTLVIILPDSNECKKFWGLVGSGIRGSTYGLVVRHLVLAECGAPGVVRDGIRRWQEVRLWILGVRDGGMEVLEDGEGKKIWLRTGRRDCRTTI